MLDRRALVASTALSLSAPPATLNLPSIPLRDGSRLPLATFGIQIYDDDTAFETTTLALNAGFRSFFTSPEAGNQRGFARAIAQSDVPRGALHIAASVLSDDADGFRAARATTARRCAASLADLAACGGIDMLMLERAGGDAASIRGQWRGLEEQQIGRLGVANFDLEQLDAARAGARRPPLVNQLPYSLGVRMPHATVLREHLDRGVQLQAWGPLGGPFYGLPPRVVDECASIGRRRGGRSAQQVALRWITQQGVPFVVHSRSASHLRDDLAAVDQPALSDDEMATLARLAESV